MTDYPTDEQRQALHDVLRSHDNDYDEQIQDKSGLKKIKRINEFLTCPKHTKMTDYGAHIHHPLKPFILTNAAGVSSLAAHQGFRDLTLQGKDVKCSMQLNQHFKLITMVPHTFGSTSFHHFA